MPDDGEEDEVALGEAALGDAAAWPFDEGAELVDSLAMVTADDAGAEEPADEVAGVSSEIGLLSAGAPTGSGGAKGWLLRTMSHVAAATQPPRTTPLPSARR